MTQLFINVQFKTFLFLTFRHIPKAKATSIAETPETKRIAENTKLQSNAKYHADFEKAKGKLTQVSINNDFKICAKYNEI